jgi:hypothetical protein
MAASIVPTGTATLTERLRVARCVAYLKNSLISRSRLRFARWRTSAASGGYHDCRHTGQHTADDLTNETVARVLAVALVEDGP